MSFSRRKFLRTGTMVAISAGIPLRSLVAQTLMQSGSLLSTKSDAGLVLDRKTFSRYLNTEFFFSFNSVNASVVKLIEVNDLTPKAAKADAGNKECFALVFSGSADAPLKQETYAITHESLGTFAMLAVPIGINKEVAFYEAVFNRLH